MDKDICTLGYIAKEINKAVSEGRLEKDISPLQESCLDCTKDNRCNYFLPLKRIQHVREEEILYRRKYTK